jgi:hypothetical protein
MTNSNNEQDDTIWVNGYHGTSRRRAENILAAGFRPSTNGYDWLGTGVYFWQDAPNHALHWAQQNHPTEPAVIKSRLRIDNTCLDLLDMSGMNNSNFWTNSYNGFTEMYQKGGQNLPTQNPTIPGKRRLDCAFFDYFINTFAKQSIIYGASKTIGSVRSAFVEGNPIFPGSAVYDQTHVQISIINLDLIESSFIYEY